MNCSVPDGIDLEWSHCRPLLNEQPNYIMCKICHIKKKLPCCWARHSSCRVWSGEGWRHSARRGGRPCRDSWKPRRRSLTTSSSGRSRWTAGTGWNDWHECFVWVNCDFDFPTVSLILGYLGLRQHGREVKISATKALGREKKLQKLPKKNTNYKTQNTKTK